MSIVKICFYCETTRKKNIEILYYVGLVEGNMEFSKRN